MASLTSPSRADDAKKACIDAYGQAQSLRDAHKLREARDQMRVCSQSACPSFITRDCTTWLGEIESRVPSVVLAANDVLGRALSEVTVSVDGLPLVKSLDGDAVEVDPGLRTFTFVASDGTKVDRRFMVLEGQKSQLVSVSFGGPPLPATQVPPPPAAQPVAPPPPPPAGSGADAGPRSEPAGPPASASFWNTQRTLGVTAAGVGVAGIVVGSVFGLMTESEIHQQKQDCASATNCPNYAQAASAHSQWTTNSAVSTATFVAGGVLVAGGLVLFYTAHPTSAQSQTTAWWLAPAVGPDGGRVQVGGSF